MSGKQPVHKVENVRRVRGASIAARPGNIRSCVCSTALLTLLFWWISAAANAQISPGPLSQAHQELEGPSGCVKCHALSPGSPNFRCLECHRDIAVRLEKKRGYHAALIGSAPGSTSCVRCHSEHNGRGFAIVKWNPQQLEHAKTGFVLDGKHAELACQRCHASKNIAAQERQALTVRDQSRTYLGLSQACASCHEDKHQGRLGGTCQQCHNTSSWNKVEKFDHAKTRFPLTGEHRSAKCQSCHLPKPDGSVTYVGLRFERCEDCHRDVHRGEFKQNCQQCHSTGGWKQTTFVREFDHSKTKFVLAGKHLEVACSTCHKGGDFKSPIAHDLCSDCHKPDPHSGQFARRKDGGRCESCHTVEGWKPSKFLAADHASTQFPLHDKHATVDCAKCHVPAGKATLFKVKFARCADCHQDLHKGQFAKEPYRNRCEKCHTEKSFHAPTFSVEQHQKTSFALTGGHMAVPCLQCHNAAAPGETAPYHFDALSCESCHADPHRGQFRARMARISSTGRILGCEACHTTREWQDLRLFDHGSTTFPLMGAHRAVECSGCHRPADMERSLLHTDFHAAPTQCEECHNDPHGSQFAHSDRITRCAECHDAGRWRPSLFDHEKTIFTLKGAHQNTPCRSCHTQFRTVADKEVVFYKPTPTKCAVCHQAKVERSL